MTFTSEKFKPVRVGLLGCSDIARRKLLPALLASDGAVLAAVASRSPQQAAAFAPGATYRSCDYAELLADDAVELIYLSLPNHLHEAWALRALTAGKDVICEKPLGLSRSAVERMLTAAEAHGRLLYENLMFLHHPQHRVVKELVADGTIGRLIALRSVFGFPLPQAGNFRLNPSLGGGAFHDLARYPLGVALNFLCGELRDFHGISVDQDRLNLALHGVARSTAAEHFSFSIAFGQQYEAFYELVGEGGKIRVERPYTTPADLANRIFITRGTAETVHTVPPADHFRLMLDHVCGLIRGERSFRQLHDRSRQIALLAERMELGCRHEQ